MSSPIGGPKAAPGQRSPALARFLEAERQKRAERQETHDAAAVETGTEPAGRGTLDRFADVPGLSAHAHQVMGTESAPFAPLVQQGQGALSVRLGALTGSREVPSARERAEPLGHSGLRVVNGPSGKVAEGDLSVRGASDLALLAGVVLLRGSLDLSETRLSAGELTALRSLTRVDGGLALEGNAALEQLDALSQLTHVGGSLYLGFNDGLTRAALPSLERVGGALVVEGNRTLEELSLPALTQVGTYLHLHENDVLAQVTLPRLSALGGKLSLLDNPRLHDGALASLRVAPPSIS